MGSWKYIVLRQDDGWLITLSGNRFGPYSSRDCAVRVAKNAAEAAGRKGHLAEVIIGDGVQVWTAREGPAIKRLGTN